MATANALLAVTLCLLLVTSWAWPEEAEAIRGDGSPYEPEGPKDRRRNPYRMGYLFGKRSEPDPRFLRALTRDQRVSEVSYELSYDVDKLLPLTIRDYLQMKARE